MQTPQDIGNSPIEEHLSPSRSLYEGYPCKSANGRLIDIKNSTWRTKYEMAKKGGHLQGKMLYTIGPREAYVVDQLFDREMNYYDLGRLSHDGEMIFRKTEEKTYYVDLETGYNNELSNSKSKITPEMRAKLHDQMAQEHEIIVTSPKKYQR